LARNTSSDDPRCWGSTAGGGGAAGSGGPPNSRRHSDIRGLANVDLVAIGEDAVLADQLDAQLSERLVVERHGPAAAAAEQRAAALEHDIEAQAERREIEPAV